MALVNKEWLGRWIELENTSPITSAKRNGKMLLLAIKAQGHPAYSIATCLFKYPGRQTKPTNTDIIKFILKWGKHRSKSTLRTPLDGLPRTLLAFSPPFTSPEGIVFSLFFPFLFMPFPINLFKSCLEYLKVTAYEHIYLKFTIYNVW